MKKSQLKKIIREAIRETLNEQRDVCAQLQTTNSSLYNYCYSHCNMGIGAMPSECPSDFINTCCPGEEEGCPEGMIDDTSPLWPLCIKCYTGSSDDSTITGTPPDCECCRPMDTEPEEKLTCYKCQKKGGNQVVAVQFPNSLSAWANFNFQGECPKGFTTDPDPCRPGVQASSMVNNKRRLRKADGSGKRRNRR